MASLRYTAAQQQAIECVDRPLQIIASAGSGKTQVISERIASLLLHGLAEPRNVVAFTFTDKAAAELKDRILSLVEAHNPDAAGMAEMFVGTMHGYALNLLQTYLPEAFKYSVLNEAQNRLFIDRYSKQSGLTTCPTAAQKVPFLRRYRDSRLYMQALGILREDEVDYSVVDSRVLDSLRAYVKLLRDHAYFDYTQIVLAAVGCLEETSDPRLEPIHRHIADDVKFVVVDEYQDVNPVQERLIAGLIQYGANLCVVGDDDQTVYQWRGSQVSNILSFAERRGPVEQVTLADNFRSSKGIVELGRAVAERIPTGSRLPKTMQAAGHQTFDRGDILALEFDEPGNEAAWICDRIEAMRGVRFVDAPGSHERGLSWSDFAVLFRSVAKDADVLAQEMRSRGIPFVVKGLNRLFDSPEIQAVVSLFLYMDGQLDATSLERSWADADLVPSGSVFSSAMAVLEEGRDYSKGARWGIYNIQRLYLDVLDALNLREDTVPDPSGLGRGEIVSYQFGKFSQAISDFEQINFATSPAEKYHNFAQWLVHQAPDYYAESESDAGYATPDAVAITTVHQAKGMQWPAVFIPCLRRNRFPSQRHGGLSIFHVIPDSAIEDADRYRGTLDDETRLFYVAVTRAQKFLYLTYSPSTRPYVKRSEFFDFVTRNSYVLTADAGVPAGGRLTPHARQEIPQVALSFSELKYLFECPYQFKIRFLYGFNPPLHEALGFGKGLHDTLSEIHKRAIAGDVVDHSAVEELVDRHLTTPFAYPELRDNLRDAAIKAVNRYLTDHGSELSRLEHSEKQIEVHVTPGVTVAGRIDLIRRLDTDELSIVDFKSSERAQAEEVTRDQLHVYVLGYEELSGERADLIEVLNLDPGARSDRQVVQPALIEDVRDRISSAGEALRMGELPPHTNWCSACDRCDVRALCPTGALKQPTVPT